MEIRPDQLGAQYERAVADWPFFHDIEAEYGLPPFLLFAVGSRETNLRKAFTEGQIHDDGHGHGLFGRDDRYWPIPDGFDTDPRAQATLSAEHLAANIRTYGLDGGVDRYGPAGARPQYRLDVLERRAWLEANYGTPATGGHVMQLVSRDDAGLRAPRSRTALSVSVATAHWGGDSPGELDHDECAGIWRGWQRQHMDTAQLAPQGAADIAYNFGVCQHGYVFEGRGVGARSAANGSNDGNSSSYAIVYIGGTPAPFTDEAKHGFNDAAELLGASLDWGHRDWVGTGCPGDEIYGWVQAGHPRPGPVSRPGGKQRRRSRIPFLVSEEDTMPTPFRRRPDDFAFDEDRPDVRVPCYDAEWVGESRLPLPDGLQWTVNIHIQQLSPVPGRVADIGVYGPGVAQSEWTVTGGETIEIQPHTYGPVAVVSESGIELACSWERVLTAAPAA